MEGFLFKRGEGFLGRWLQRYFRENDAGQIQYFKQKNSPAAQGSINIAEIVDAKNKDDNFGRIDQFGFVIILQLTDRQREFHICATSEQDRNLWVNGIKERLNIINYYSSLEPWKHNLYKSARSVLVTISNQSASVLSFKDCVMHGSGTRHGRWIQQPMNDIHPGESLAFGCQSSDFQTGVKASVIFQVEGFDFLFNWENPFSGKRTMSTIFSTQAYRVTSSEMDDFVQDDPLHIHVWTIAFSVSAPRGHEARVLTTNQDDDPGLFSLFGALSTLMSHQDFVEPEARGGKESSPEDRTLETPPSRPREPAALSSSNTRQSSDSPPASLTFEGDASTDESVTNTFSSSSPVEHPVSSHPSSPNLSRQKQPIPQHDTGTGSSIPVQAIPTTRRTSGSLSGPLLPHRNNHHGANKRGKKLATIEGDELSPVSVRSKPCVIAEDMVEPPIGAHSPNLPPRLTQIK